MPPYFSMAVYFAHKRIKPGFVKEIYLQIISGGFSSKCGYWLHEKASPDEIIEWTQKLLEDGFSPGFTQHARHDYMQIHFKQFSIQNCEDSGHLLTNRQNMN